MKTETNKAGDWLRNASLRLNNRTDQPGLVAQLILAEVLQQARSRLMAHPEWDLTLEQIGLANGLLERTTAGEPLAYMLGHCEFYGMDFLVSPAVLIPRPETELMVEIGLDWLTAHPSRRLAADVGTGSGCIAVAFAHHKADLQVLALDVSDLVLELAQKNIERHGLTQQVHLINSNLLGNLVEPVDLICANLPYIPRSILDGLPVSRFEPRLALDGGEDGLLLIDQLLEQMAERALCRGLALLEIESSQGERALTLARRYFPHTNPTICQDLAGRDRLLSIQMP